MDWIEVLCYSNQFKCKSASRIKYEQLHQSVLFFERISTNISRYQPWNHYPLRTFLRSHFFLEKKIMKFIKSNSMKMKVAAPRFNESNHQNCTGKCTEDFCASTTISFLLGLLHFFRLFYYYSL